MTLFEAKPYDPARERRRKQWIIGSILSVLIIAAALFWLRNWPQERIAKNFFAALQEQQFEEAYGVWMADPDWKQHPQKYDDYPYGAFYNDWGPGGEWGRIENHEMDCSAEATGGVIVVMIVNGRHDRARVWVNKNSKQLTFVPDHIQVNCRGIG